MTKRQEKQKNKPHQNLVGQTKSKKVKDDAQHT